MDQVLPSSRVGVKINEWYKMIRQFSVPDAEILKAEVEQEIEEGRGSGFTCLLFIDVFPSSIDVRFIGARRQISGSSHSR